MEGAVRRGLLREKITVLTGVKRRQRRYRLDAHCHSVFLPLCSRDSEQNRSSSEARGSFLHLPQYLLIS